MKMSFSLCCLLLLVFSCKIVPGDDKISSDAEGVSYRLKFKPPPGSTYYYEVSNSTETSIDLEGKEIESKNITSVGMSYDITMDTTGNYLLSISYDRVRLYMKNQSGETEADSEKGSMAINPLERVLNALKNSRLVASVSPGGDIRIISGYQELSDQLLSTLNTNHPGVRAMAQQQLDKLIGDRMIQKNLDQLFGMFPDSAIRAGERWQIESREDGDFSLNVKSSYRLKEVDNGIATITASSELESDKTPIAMLGYSAVPNLKGTQEAMYKVEAKTGMLLSGTVTSKLKGNIQMAGRDVPVGIEVKVSINGKKVE